MTTFFSVIISLAVIAWILRPLFVDIEIANIEDPKSDLENRYTRALLDLESDLLGGRIDDSEFRRRREGLSRAMSEKKQEGAH